MKKKIDSTDENVDIVDIEEQALAGRKPPRARRFRIRVDDDRFVVEKPVLTGREILELSGRTPTEDYFLIQHMRGSDNEIINLDEQVDLTRKGIERFVTARLGDEDLVVTVYAPRTPEPKTFIWATTKRVGDAAQEAADAFGYEAGTPGLQKGDDVLDNNKTLEAAGVEHCDKLELVDTGGGV